MGLILEGKSLRCAHQEHFFPLNLGFSFTGQANLVAVLICRGGLLSDSILKWFIGNEFSWSKPILSSVAQSCPTLCDPMDCSTPGFPFHHQLRSLLKLMSIKSVLPSNHLILCHPLLLLPSIFPSIRVFSKESVVCIRWPKYWSSIQHESFQ